MNDSLLHPKQIIDGVFGAKLCPGFAKRAMGKVPAHRFGLFKNISDVKRIRQFKQIHESEVCPTLPEDERQVC